MKLHCEKCGAGIQAPREMAGSMGKCPSCNNSMYIPTPEDEIEELPLVAEDTLDLQKEARLQAERRRLDSLLAHENRIPDAADGSDAHARTSAATGRSGMAESGAAGSSSRTEQALHKYLTAVRDSDLDTAERALNVLKLQPRTARELIDRLAADQIPPPEVANVHPGVYQGMLKTLRGKL